MGGEGSRTRTICGMRHVVESELVANVIAVHVNAGQRVEPGTEVLLLESMKMEIPVLTEVAGTVAAVRVDTGDVVQEGEVLVVLDD